MSYVGKCPRVAKVQVVNIRVADALGWQKSGGKSPGGKSPGGKCPKLVQK